METRIPKKAFLYLQKRNKLQKSYLLNDSIKKSIKTAA